MINLKPNSVRKKMCFNKSVTWQKHLSTKKYHTKKRYTFLQRNVHREMSHEKKPEGKHRVN